MKLTGYFDTLLNDTETLGDLRYRLIGLAGDRDHVATELHRECFGHDQHPSSEDQDPHKSGVNRTRCSPTHASTASKAPAGPEAPTPQSHSSASAAPSPQGANPPRPTHQQPHSRPTHATSRRACQRA